MKHETLVSVTILSVVTTVFIGVWSNGFGLFSHKLTSLTPAWTGTAAPGAVPGRGGVFSGHDTINGLDQQGATALAVPAAGGSSVGVFSGSTPAVPPGGTPSALGGSVEPVAPRAPNFIPSAVQLYEAHWQGMDTRVLTTELRQKLRYPRGLEGVLVGEVSLAAGRSGLLGGDVIVGVEGQPVTNLEMFQEATRAVADRTQATISALRKSGPKDANGNRTSILRLNLALASERPLGFAQVEGAPMIKAGDPRPHPDRGPCTQCHSIGAGFELTPDPDLITLPPPVLARDVVARGGRPHEDRGPCLACHVVAP